MTRKVIESKSLSDEHINNVTSLLSLWYRSGHFTEVRDTSWSWSYRLLILRQRVFCIQASDCHRAIGEILARASLVQSSDFSPRKNTKIEAIAPSTDEEEAITHVDFRKTVKRGYPQHLFSEADSLLGDFENSDKGDDPEEDLSESGDAPVNASMVRDTWLDTGVTYLTTSFEQHAGSPEAFDSGTEVVAVPSRKAVSAPTASKGKKVASRKGKARKPMFDKGKAAELKKASKNICARKPRKAQLQTSKPVPTHPTAKDKLSEVMGDEFYVATQAETSSEDD